MMTLDNKELMQYIFEQLSVGNDQPFLDAMADEISWTWMGSGEWSKAFVGKNEVVDGLWSAVRKTLRPPYKTVANNFMADGEYVTVEAIGDNLTPDGRPYRNKYCWVCRLRDGKIFELKEYMDTELVNRTFPEEPVKIIDEKFMFDFGTAKAVIHFQGENLLHFLIEKEGVLLNESETVEVSRTPIRPNVYLVTWKEKNSTHVIQIQDFQHGIVYSNWVSSDGQFHNGKAIIHAMNEKQ